MTSENNERHYFVVGIQYDNGTWHAYLEPTGQGPEGECIYDRVNDTWEIGSARVQVRDHSFLMLMREVIERLNKRLENPHVAS